MALDYLLKSRTDMPRKPWKRSIKMIREMTIEEMNAKRPKDSRWTIQEVLRIDTNKTNRRFVIAKCVCECGTIREKRVSEILTKGGFMSCGCLQKDKNRHRKGATPGSTKVLKRVYRGMICRCYDPKHKNYDRYGGSGVTVCDEWLNDYGSFVKWANDNNWERGLQVDKDIIAIKTGLPPNLYSPDRCSIVTRQQNMAYQKSAVRYDYKGERLTLREISNTCGISAKTLRDRIARYNWSIERATTERVNTKSIIWNRKK